MAFWVRIPADAPLEANGAFAEWALKKEGKGGGARPVEVSWNNDPSTGPLGALRSSAGGLGIVGTTSLRDGRWHHVAVVMLPLNKEKDPQMILRQYVDGRLERRSGIKTSNRTGPAPDDTIRIGRGFRGEMDEFFLSNRDIATQDIRNLCRNNKLSMP